MNALFKHLRSPGIAVARRRLLALAAMTAFIAGEVWLINFQLPGQLDNRTVTANLGHESLRVNSMTGTPLLSHVGTEGEVAEIRIDKGRLSDKTERFLRALHAPVLIGDNYPIVDIDAGGAGSRNCRCTLRVTSPSHPTQNSDPAGSQSHATLLFYQKEPGAEDNRSIVISSQDTDLNITLWTDKSQLPQSQDVEPPSGAGCKHSLRLGNSPTISISALMPITFVVPRKQKATLSFISASKAVDKNLLTFGDQHIDFAGVDVLETGDDNSGTATTRAWSTRHGVLTAKNLQVDGAAIKLTFGGYGYYTSPSEPANVLERMEKVPMFGVMIGAIEVAIFGWFVAQLGSQKDKKAKTKSK